MTTDSKPLLVFDGDCDFCRFWVERWRSLVGERVSFEPYKRVADSFPDIPLEKFRQSVVLKDETGTLWYGARAVFGVLAFAPNRRWLRFCYEYMPGFGSLSEYAYRLVARHRHSFAIVTRCLWGVHPEPPECRVVRWIFLRALAFIYLCAFLSLWVQIHGLIGSDGILPAASFLETVRQYLGANCYWQVPTLAWLSSSDLSLHLLCAAGCALSLVAFVGWLEGPCFLMLWLLYLSLVQIGQEFLSFQWDNLLLETGLLACLFSTWVWRSRAGTDVPSRRLVLWLLRLLLFKLMIMSGLAKLLSGDSTWRDLTALGFHYQTQPLPTWIGWYVALLPLWFHKLSVLVMFAVELAVPFLIFLPRRSRLLAFWSALGLQVMILLTGNYGVFNWLTIALCLVLLDDLSLRPILRSTSVQGRAPDKSASVGRRFRSSILAAYAVVFMSLSAAQIVMGFGSRYRALPIFTDLERWASPLRSINRYGLFSVMTTRRPEIIIEGSDDGQHWQPYEFKWKPGSLSRRPAFVAPHMPRLDWQMWFAALSQRRQERWFDELMRRLLEGSTSVTRLLASNPFPDHPPRYLRALLYEYRFADFAAHRSHNDWWQLRLLGTYAPAVSR